MALASQDLERGWSLLQAKKGANRLASADAAFTAVIARLTPAQDALDVQGRLVLARALDGRGQTNVQRGRLKAADTDFEQLVTLDPSYEPDAEKTPRRTLDRFKKVRTPRIGFLALKIDPPEAEILLDGRSLGPAASLAAERAVLAGPFTLRARRDCYEEKEVSGTVGVGEKKPIALTLDAFARLVRFETVPAGFDVDIDGTYVGTTVERAPKNDAAPAEEPGPVAGGEEGENEGAGSAANGSADEAIAPESVKGGTGHGSGVLELSCIAAGSHEYTVRRGCYADVHGRLDVEIDLLDRTPIVVPPVTPAKRETHLSVTTDTPGAALFIDGDPAGPLPVRERTLCAPSARLEARVKDRVIWSETRALEDGPLEIRARRRPTLSLAFADSREEAPSTTWVERIRGRWEGLSSFNLTHEAPASGADPAPGAVTLLRDDGHPPGPPADLRLEVGAGPGKAREGIALRLVPLALPDRSFEWTCDGADEGCLDRYFDALDAASAPEPGTSIPAPGSSKVFPPRAIAAALLDASVLPAGRERNASLMSLASTLIEAGAYREALEQSLERPLWADGVTGPASRGSAAFLAGVCHQELGEGAAARAAFARAATDPGATLWTDDLPVAPLARLLLATKQ